MKRKRGFGITPCTPAWRHHEWVVEAKSPSKIYKVPTAIKCAHCDQVIKGAIQCDLAIQRDGLFQPNKVITRDGM